MTIAMIFWILMLIWAVFGIFGAVQPMPGNRYVYGHGLFIFILFLLLGIGVFGSPIKGS